MKLNGHCFHYMYLWKTSDVFQDVTFKIPAFPRKNSQLAGILENYCPDAVTSSLCTNESQNDGTNMVISNIREKG